jgi:hypothetical protein
MGRNTPLGAPAFVLFLICKEFATGFDILKNKYRNKNLFVKGFMPMAKRVSRVRHFPGLYDVRENRISGDNRAIVQKISCREQKRLDNP